MAAVRIEPGTFLDTRILRYYASHRKMESEILLALNRTKSDTSISVAQPALQTLQTAIRSLFDMLINVAFQAEFNAHTRRFKSLNAHLRVEK